MSGKVTQSSGSNDPAHFVPLSVIIDKHQGKLSTYMSTANSHDVAVTMPVTIDVAKKKNQKFFVVVAVTMNFETAEAVNDEAMRQCPKGHQCLFAWVPAHLFGSDDFGIFIDELGIGENLQNGLVGEVINAAAIEEAVIGLMT